MNLNIYNNIGFSTRSSSSARASLIFGEVASIRSLLLASEVHLEIKSVLLSLDLILLRLRSNTLQSGNSALLRCPREVFEMIRDLIFHDGLWSVQRRWMKEYIRSTWSQSNRGWTEYQKLEKRPTRSEREHPDYAFVKECSERLMSCEDWVKWAGLKLLWPGTKTFEGGSKSAAYHSHILRHEWKRPVSFPFLILTSPERHSQRLRYDSSKLTRFLRFFNLSTLGPPGYTTEIEFGEDPSKLPIDTLISPIFHSSNYNEDDEAYAFTSRWAPEMSGFRQVTLPDLEQRTLKNTLRYLGNKYGVEFLKEERTNVDNAKSRKNATATEGMEEEDPEGREEVQKEVEIFGHTPEPRLIMWCTVHDLAR